MSRIHANNFGTTINAAISNSDTSIVLSSVTGFPSIGAGVTCNLTLQSGNTIEIVTATARSSFTLTVTRASEGTTAVAWDVGTSISIRPTADSVDRKEDLISGRSLTAVTVATGDKVLIQDLSDSSNLKTVTAQSIADLASGLADGDKGDITVASSGSVWTIDTPTSATVATDDKVLIKDTSASDATKYVTSQSIADLSLTFKTIAVSGQSDVVADSGTDTLTLVAGSNVTLTTNASTDTITIAASGGGGSGVGLTWNTASGTTQAASVNNGYVCTNASACTVTLPATAAVGDIVHVVSKGAGGIVVAANTSQTINGVGQATSSAGSITPAAQYDSLKVVCVVANTTWAIESFTSTLLTFS